MKRLKDGTYLNLDLILEISVLPFYKEDREIFIITYWDMLGEEEQIPGLFNTEEEAQKALDELMDDAFAYSDHFKEDIIHQLWHMVEEIKKIHKKD